MEKRKILIIDDESDFRTMLKLNLEENGEFEILGISDGREVLDKVYTFRPDLILLDLIMPMIGGLDVCEILNGDSQGKNIPIIILSALDKKGDKLKAYKMGVVDYIEKPIDPEILFIKIRKALKYK
ncbi:MAG: response regulator [Candidatus Omnitrophica bacterium]|nr:response regulator [Candidatus Omnitrophota bacterium]